MQIKTFKFGMLVCLLATAICFAEFDARKEIIKFMEGNKELEKYRTAPVTISHADGGILSIKDEGIFAFQHELLKPEIAADPNVVIKKGVTIHPKADKLVIVTHGWMDKGEDDWPVDITAAIHERVDPNEWVCGTYDWKGGSVVITSVQAAEYARDIAGPRLAKAILEIGSNFKHIHLIAHSAGSWTIHAAAQKVAEARPGTQFHLTFLDAYVPSKWDPDTLGHIFVDPKKQKNQYWAEHYYTKDITYKVTQDDLKYAHNVDISAIDPLISEHEFPYRWYLATITGKYDRWDEKKKTVYTRSGDVDYGFARALESGIKNWKRSKKLKPNNTAVKIEKKNGSN